MEREQVLLRLFGKHCPAGQELYAAGSPGEDLFVVVGGCVRLSRAGEACGEERGPGEILGEEAFFGRAPRAGTAVAVADAQLLRLSGRTLDAVVRHGPEVARAVFERLLELGGRSARELDALVSSRRAGRPPGAHLPEREG